MSRFFRGSDSESSDTDSDESSLSEGGQSDDGLKTKKTGVAGAAAGKTASGSSGVKKSRFLKGSDDDDESSDSDSEEDSDEEDDDESGSSASDEDEQTGKVAGRKGSRFLVSAGADSSSDDSDSVGKKIVKSARDKRFDEMGSAIKNIENAQKINDWVVISNEFDRLNKLLQRSQATAAVAPTKPPPVYVAAMAQLEDFLAEALSANKDSGRKMNATNARALNGMKQRLRKNNKVFEKEIATYRQDPEDYMQEDEEVVEVAPARSVRSTILNETIRVAQAGEDEDDDFTTVGKGGKAMTFTSEGVFKALRAVFEARGKKNTDRTEQITILRKLYEVSVTPYQKIRTLLALIAARFDYNPSMAGYMILDQWSSAIKELMALLTELEGNPAYVVVEETPDYDEEEDRIPGQNGQEAVVQVRGSIIGFVDRLDEEFIKSLQNIDPHTPEYVDRLRDEMVLYNVIVRSQCYYERVGNSTESLCRVIMRRLEHIYYKSSIVIEAMEKKIAQELPQGLESGVAPLPSDSANNASTLIDALCVYLFRESSSLLRTRALLVQVYHQALCNHYHRARDLLLMSHLQETIHGADVASQILFNRTMVQIGLAAFRQGLIRESQQALSDAFGTGRVKELLAQGMQPQRFSNLTVEQEKLDKQRQLPFHMHINIELLESCYLVSSMLLEIPLMAAATHSHAGTSVADARRRIISRPFRRMLEYSERQAFTGPPENTRDHIMQASKALAACDWRRARDLVLAVKAWALLPAPGSEAIKAMLDHKLREEGLRTYLFTSASHYDSAGLDQLAKMFDLPVEQIQAIVSRMIFNEEIAASLDSRADAVAPAIDVSLATEETKSEATPSLLIVFNRSDTTRMQQIAITLAEKAHGFMDQNERTFEQKTQRSDPVDAKRVIVDREERDNEASGGAAGGGGDRSSRGGPGMGLKRFSGRGGRGGPGLSRGTSRFTGGLGASVRGGPGRKGLPVGA